MNLEPNNQLNLYGYKNDFNRLVKLYNETKLPNKILLSGQKGIGKCTFAYHLINYALTKGENFSYDLDFHLINNNSKAFKLIQNGTSPNFTLVDVVPDKKNIEIDQIRNLIKFLRTSSLNLKPRFILIDNIEFLNINSINALLKILEEPTDNTFFILIHNNKKILPTLLSRCLNFKLNISYQNMITITKKLLNANIHEIINDDLLNYYVTPGYLYRLVYFSNEHNINLKTIKLKDFLKLLIEESFYKKNKTIKNMILDFVEVYLVNKISIKSSNLYNYFLNRITKTKMFNLDEESLFIEINSKLLNG
tara:strand:- start:4126 stop:5046 length:921 start_codon:yes stop_codon:yes gene_type:complete